MLYFIRLDVHLDKAQGTWWGRANPWAPDAAVRNFRVQPGWSAARRELILRREYAYGFVS